MRITAIVGTYHKGGMINTAVDEILVAIASRRAEIEKVYLIDHRMVGNRRAQ